MKRLYFNIDKENNKVILDRKDFDYLMSIGHYNDKAKKFIEENRCWWYEQEDADDLLDILNGIEPKERKSYFKTDEEEEE